MLELKSAILLLVFCSFLPLAIPMFLFSYLPESYLNIFEDIIFIYLQCL